MRIELGRHTWKVAKVPEEPHAAAETSAWPALLGLSLTVFVVGLTLNVWFGLALLLFLLYASWGWSRDNWRIHARRPASDIEPGRTKIWWAMVLVIVSEAMLFAAAFVVLVMHGTLKDPGPELRGLNTPTAFVASLVLWSSGATGMMAMRRLERNRPASFRRWLLATILLGLAFMLYQVNEYRILVGEGFVPSASRDASVFYGLTGLHGSHVVGGLVLLVAMLAFGGRRLAPPKHGPMQASMRYWHFVDAVWVAVYGTLYLGLL